MHNGDMDAPDRSPPDAGFRHRLRVYFEDTDAAGIVYYANYLKFMERARTEWLRQLGIAHADLVATQHGVFVVQGVGMSYHQPARLEELLDVLTTIREIGRATLTVDQWILRERTCLVTGSIRLGYVDTRTLRPKRMPDALTDLLRAA